MTQTLAHAASDKHQASVELRDLHEQSLEPIFERLEAADDHSAMLAMLVRTAQLRARQADAASTGWREAALFERGYHLRRAAWVGIS